MTEPTAPVSDPAAAAPAPPSHGGFSPDGAWWWDGVQWVPTITADGRWRWDGQAWQVLRALDLDNPAAAQADLVATADDLFAQAGALGSQRRMEWPVPPDLFPVLQALDAATVTMNARRGRDKQQAAAQVHAIAADLGRRITGGAPPEVSALLDLGRRQIFVANSLASAQAALVEAQAAHEASVVAARSAQAAAEAARSDALTAAQAAVDEAERARSAALAGLRSRVKELRLPGAGMELGRFGAVVLFERMVETPEGHGLVAGSSASVMPVEQVFASRRELVDRLSALGGYAGQLLAEADWRWPGHQFLMVETSTVASVVPVAAEEVDAASAFASLVGEAAVKAAAAAVEARAALTAAEAELAAASSDEKAVKAARAQREKVGADASLPGAVESARAALSAAESDLTAVDAARAKLAAAGRVALEPPAPLGGVPTPAA